MKPIGLSTKAKNLARELLKKNRTRTWRQIAKDDYGDRVSFAILNKFANRGGDYIPDDPKVLAELGLIRTKSPYRTMPRWWNRTPEALNAFLHIRGQAKSLSENTRREQYAYKQVKQ